MNKCFRCGMTTKASHTVSNNLIDSLFSFKSNHIITVPCWIKIYCEWIKRFKTKQDFARKLISYLQFLDFWGYFRNISPWEHNIKSKKHFSNQGCSILSPQMNFSCSTNFEHTHVDFRFIKMPQFRNNVKRFETL